MTKLTTIVLALTVLASIAPAEAQRGTDRAFLIAAEQGGNTEIQAGQIARQRGVSQLVRSLGMRMIADHTNAGNRLGLIARAQGMPVISSPGAQGMQTIAMLRSVSAMRFDRAYVRGQIAAHRQTIALLENEISSGTNRALRDWARMTLPTVRLHLSLFQSALGRT